MNWDCEAEAFATLYQTSATVWVDCDVANDVVRFECNGVPAGGLYVNNLREMCPVITVEQIDVTATLIDGDDAPASAPTSASASSSSSDPAPVVSLQSTASASASASGQ
jgi:hypothetical protein